MSAVIRLPESVTAETPGVLVAVISDGQIVELAARGRATLEHDVPLGRDTAFAIASTSKQFTAAAAVLLHQEGVLDLDGDLRDLLPELRLRPRVSLRQCLQHTAGLREYMALCGVLGGGTDTWFDEARAVRVLAAQLDTDFVPGTDHCYSNSGYVLAAAAVRAASGKGLAAVAQERLFAPLGMTRTRFEDTARLPQPGRAAGYTPYQGLFIRAISVDEVVGDGGMISVAEDLARWTSFLTDGRVLGEELRDALRVPARLSDGRELRYALGLVTGETGGVATLGHGGAIEGFRSHLVCAPEADLGVVVLANRSDLDAEELATRTLAAAMGVSPSTATLSPRAGSGVGGPVGVWWDETTELALVVAEEADGAHAAHLGPMRWQLRRVDGAWHSTTPGSTATLSVNDDVAVLRMSATDAEPRTYRRQAETAPADPLLLAGTYLSPELGALAVLEVDGDVSTLRLGGGGPMPLKWWRADTATWPLGTVRIEPGDAGGGSRLLLSGLRYRRLRFERLPDDARPLGYPVPFGGPVPEDPA